MDTPPVLTAEESRSDYVLEMYDIRDLTFTPFVSTKDARALGLRYREVEAKRAAKLAKTLARMSRSKLAIIASRP